VARRSPGKQDPHHIEALKVRNTIMPARATSGNSMSPLQGFTNIYRRQLPRAAPWAITLRPFRPNPIASPPQPARFRYRSDRIARRRAGRFRARCSRFWCASTILQLRRSGM
jgi:hypothetical protein